jgi:hypothetical protein
MALKYTKKGEKMKKKQKESAYTLMYAFLALILILFVVILVNYDKPLVGKADAPVYSDDLDDPTVSIGGVLAGDEVQFGFPTADGDQYELTVGAFDPVTGLEVNIVKVEGGDGDEEICDNLIDDDADGLIDCFDEECDDPDVLSCMFNNVPCVVNAEGLVNYVSGPKTCCYETTDCDQGAGEDCKDNLCDVDAVPETNCADGIDNDENELTDCEDLNCVGQIGPMGFECCQVTLDCPNDGGVVFSCFTDKFVCLDQAEFPPCDIVAQNCAGGKTCVFIFDSQSTVCVGEELCQDGIDNDLDGLLDMLDDDCNGFNPDLGEDGYQDGCKNSDDDDQDGEADCLDLDCHGKVGGQVGGIDMVCEFDMEGTCDDEFDNDGDGDPDCGDQDCINSFPALCNDNSEICDDLIDNDDDGSNNCDDPDCDYFYTCGGTETCDDGLDNNGDGLIDCADPTCDGSPTSFQGLQYMCHNPNEIVCDDGFDNNGVNGVDCVDPTCNGAIVGMNPNGDIVCELGQELSCDDLFDNDGNGEEDCFDPDCAADPACAADDVENCLTYADEDGNGFAACMDPVCSGGLGPEGDVCCTPAYGQNTDHCEDGQYCSDFVCEDKITVGLPCQGVTMYECTTNLCLGEECTACDDTNDMFCPQETACITGKCLIPCYTVPNFCPDGTQCDETETSQSYGACVEVQ